MPIFSFQFNPPSAGCVEKVVMSTPWNQPQRHPQTGQAMQPTDAAWVWLQGYANQRDANGNPVLFFPPGCSVGCQQIGTGGEGQQPNVISVQTTVASADRQQINAPYGQPVGNGRQLTMPPIASKERLVPQGLYEPLSDVALASNADPLMGEMDGEGGTFTDFSPITGVETVREYAMPPSPKVAGR